MLERSPGYVLAVSLAIVVLGGFMCSFAPILGGIIVSIGLVPLVLVIGVIARRVSSKGAENV